MRPHAHQESIKILLGHIMKLLEEHRAGSQADESILREQGKETGLACIVFRG